MGKRVASTVVALVVCLGAGTAHATFPGSSGRIAFVSDRDGNHEIYVMNADGSQQIRLTATTEDERKPDWSPEGRRILYDRNAYIHVLADDGSFDVRSKSCFLDFDPSWAPDGDRFVVYRQYGKVPELRVRNQDGDVDEPVVANGSGLGDPDWSPDGGAIAYAGDEFVDSGTVRGSVRLIDPDGSDDRAISAPNNDDSDPAWHPDSQTLAFSSTREGDLEIYTMGRDGSEQMRLTHDVASDFDPVWSPDGTEIAFVSNRDGDAEIFVMNADGTDVRQLTVNGSRDADPSWGIATTAEVPPPPQSPQQSCKRVAERSITLTLDGHLLATGRYGEKGDETRCSPNLEIQRKTAEGWKTVSRDWTIEDDRYEARIPDRVGRYRAHLPRSVVGFYVDRYRDVCKAASSEVVRHRH